MINENLVVESQYVRQKRQIKKEVDESVLIGDLDLTQLETNKDYTVRLEVEIMDATLGTESRYIRFQGQGDVTGWNNDAPQHIYNDTQPIKEGNSHYVLVGKIIRYSSNPNNKWMLSLRLNGFTSGYYRISNFKVEDSDEPTLYVPHRSLLTEEQQNLMKYGEYTEIKSF